MTKPRPFIAGNWKMNGLGSSLGEARELSAWLERNSGLPRVALCPPATLISRLAETLAGSAVEVGAQDCRAEASGAYTGDISAEMLVDAGARMVILGHSERRAGHGERDIDVAAKVGAALRAGLEPIVCVGESLNQHRAGRTVPIVTGQVRGSLPSELAGHAFALAYEPVWAIGSGLTPTLAEIEAIHCALREALEETLGPPGKRAPILYGGSVKPANAAEILRAREVGGALVGGASLKASEFCAIIAAA